MNALLLMLWLQVPPPAGFVTGRVLLPTGAPATGVRVYAMAVRDANDGAATALESITQTDAMGRYRLEIPPGRYYVAAGSVEQPTYFPGTPDLAAARVISI